MAKDMCHANGSTLAKEKALMQCASRLFLL